MRLPDYEERSQQHAASCNDEAFLKAARDGVLESLEIIKKDRYSEDARIRLNACKEHLILAGLYQQKVDISGKLDAIQVLLPAQDGGST